MPIYAYRCSSCGYQQDVLQKISAEPLTVCPSCGKPDFHKQLSAPAFQLKGTGWYVTDFRDNGTRPAAKDGKAGGGEGSDAAADKGTSGASSGSADGASAPAGSATPAAAGGASGSD